MATSRPALKPSSFAWHLYGEKVVLRILDAAADLVGIDHLGFEPEQKSTFLSAIQKPYGMILVTGPTGSGKTVSLGSGDF